MIASTQITSFISDWIKYGNTKSVRWYLEKYGIGMDEYRYLSMCALPAASWRITARTINHRLQKLIKLAEIELDELRHNVVKSDAKVTYSLDRLQYALDEAKKKYSEEYMNQFAEELRYD